MAAVGSVVRLLRKQPVAQSPPNRSRTPTSGASTSTAARGDGAEAAPRWLDAGGAPPAADRVATTKNEALLNDVLGVVCDVSLHRGGRYLSVKSTVELLNDTDVDMEVRTPPPSRRVCTRQGRYAVALCTKGAMP